MTRPMRAASTSHSFDRSLLGMSGRRRALISRTAEVNYHGTTSRTGSIIEISCHIWRYVFADSMKGVKRLPTKI